MGYNGRPSRSNRLASWYSLASWDFMVCRSYRGSSLKEKVLELWRLAGGSASSFLDVLWKNPNQRSRWSCPQSWEYPQIINFHRFFHSQPSILGYPHDHIRWRFPGKAPSPGDGPHPKTAKHRLRSPEFLQVLGRCARCSYGVVWTWDIPLKLCGQ